MLTGIRDEREVRSTGARPLFLPRAETSGIPGPGPKFNERYSLVAIRAGSYIYEWQASLRDKAQHRDLILSLTDRTNLFKR